MIQKLPITIDSLEPIALIGSGGFGQVWKAYQPSLDRTVAIKVGHTPLMNSTGRRRFEQECKALGRLSDHPGILDVYMSGVSETGFPYLVTEYVEGGTLESASGELSEQCLRRIGAELCQAIGAAHTSNILHRDIKPGNVFLSSDGAVVVGDFGLAKLSDGRNTTTPNVVATVAFASPEVLEGHPATTVSDVYGIAVTIASAVLGASPFISKGSNATASMVRRVLTEEPTALFDSDISPDFANVLFEAMAKDPDDRPSSAAELKQRFEQLDSPAGTVGPVRYPARIASPVDVTAKQEPDEVADGRRSLAEADDVASSRWGLNWRVFAVVGMVGVAIVGASVATLLITGDGTGVDQISADSAPPAGPTSTPETTVGGAMPEAVEAIPANPSIADDQTPGSSVATSDEPVEASTSTASTVVQQPPPTDPQPAPSTTAPPLEVGPKSTRQFQTGNRSGLVPFGPGETSSVVHGVVDLATIHEYKFDAVRGQKLDLSFVKLEGEADIRYRVFFPNGEQFVFRAEGATSKDFLAISGRYRVEVYVVNGKSGSYELNVSLR